ncbi:dnaJ domain-containing protein [Ditylenchus destructor]|nr:dnaJ domain-containing protein [Ditylenchus destructor]
MNSQLSILNCHGRVEECSPDAGLANKGASQSSAAKDSIDEETLLNRIFRRKNYYYEVLDISPDSELKEIASKYRKISSKVHPDKCHAACATDAFRVVHDAYEVLIDPERRKSYDAHLKMQTHVEVVDDDGDILWC